jgi:hypothetical protein
MSIGNILLANRSFTDIFYDNERAICAEKV